MEILPELKTPARIARLLSHPSKTWFKLFGALRDQLFVGKNIEGLDCSQIEIPRSDSSGTIRTRIYAPSEPGSSPLPVLLYIHGGGYVMGNPEMFAGIIKLFIKTRPCVVVAPDYRKAFDKPYPAALDDCYDVLLWLKDNADQLCGLKKEFIVAGHSAGGGLTAAVSLRARDQNDVKISAQFPIYPMIDDRMTTPSSQQSKDPVWSPKTNAKAWSLYLKDVLATGNHVPKYAAAARESDYKNLPPTLTYVGALDSFRDETIAYVENLQKAGVDAKYEIFDGCYHGFELIAPKAEASRKALKFLTDHFAKAVDDMNSSV